jgi:oxalate decarboxylase/phosphoglucose isomerase-like protein (cupin superfamily)
MNEIIGEEKMTETTLIKRRSTMPRDPLPECHGGEGALDWTTVLDGRDLAGRRLNFIHDDVLAPGVTIGVHTHTDDEEYYYVVSGHGVMILDGERHEIGPGDITAVYPGGEHGLENSSEGDLRIIVISVT